MDENHQRKTAGCESRKALQGKMRALPGSAAPIKRETHERPKKEVMALLERR